MTTEQSGHLCHLHTELATDIVPRHGPRGNSTARRRRSRALLPQFGKPENRPGKSLRPAPSRGGRSGRSCAVASSGRRTPLPGGDGTGIVPLFSLARRQARGLRLGGTGHGRGQEDRKLWHRVRTTCREHRDRRLRPIASHEPCVHRQRVASTDLPPSFSGLGSTIGCSSSANAADTPAIIARAGTVFTKVLRSMKHPLF